MHVVEIYGKPGCHLCEDARAVLHRVRERRSFELSEIDITSDPVLARELRHDIPVVLIDGERAFHHRVDEAELERRLALPDAPLPDAPLSDAPLSDAPLSDAPLSDAPGENA